MVSLWNSAKCMAHYYRKHINSISCRNSTGNEASFRLTTLHQAVNYPIMFQYLQSRFNSLLIKYAKSENKIVCFHCGEKSKLSLTVYVQFDGATRATCCHGCGAILQTVEELGIHDEYFAHKINIPPSLE